MRTPDRRFPRSRRILRPGRAGAVLTGACLLAGCASAAAPAKQPSVSVVTSPLATSLAGADGVAWAIVPMGGTGQQTTFWELFARPAATARWTLVTPPGVADNGGLVAAAPAAGQRLDVAVRPAGELTFSPLALTGDAGRTWGNGLIDASVAATPDAVAADGGTMLALLSDGTIDQAAAPGTNWTPLAAPGAVAGSAAGRSCQVTGLTAIALTASGTPLAAAACARPGIAGIFAFTRGTGTWRASGPVLTGSLAARQIRVLRLTGTTVGEFALLQAGTGGTASLLTAWSTDGARWTVSSPLPAGSGQVRASGTGPGGAWVLLSNGRAATISGPGGAWRELPSLPRGTAVLAAGPGGTLDALAPSGGTLTAFRLSSAGAWDQDPGHQRADSVRVVELTGCHPPAKAVGRRSNSSREYPTACDWMGGYSRCVHFFSNIASDQSDR